MAPAFAWSAGGLRYEFSGQGPDLVLVHEMGGSLESFDTLAALLAPRFRILRYDQRGAGGSVRAPRGMTIEALILCAPALSVPPERRAYLEARSDLARREGMAAVTEASLARSYPDHMRGDAARYARYRERFLANDPDDYADANMALAASRVPDLLPRLAMPCLVLAGRHDLLRPPEEVRATCALIPGARYGEIESGHLMSVQAPEALAAGILGFLGEHDD
ncbi:MAG: hypothetical protein B7Y84_15550 [Azorhizobium sp. 32-67-21]|nr:MAG: hypothetical protein B7Y84_15550 [Azorhizobium sp. 32-67-21]